ncbi:MAG: hypothetical protein IT442_05685 [Phycisphaeraceae bacterium]|nr:hypothetical protein [Phycisphaeraceae bacterium]
MNHKPVTLTRQAHKTMDDYLQQVRTAMERSSVSGEQIRSVLADLEGQILDMLAAHDIHEAQESDVRSVLATLDPPEDYASGAATSPAQLPPSPTRESDSAPFPTSHSIRPRLSKLAVISALLTGPCVLITFSAFLLLLPATIHRTTHSPATQPNAVYGNGVTIVAVPQIMVAFTMICAPSVVTGLIAISRIRHSQGQLYGLGWAYFGVATTPLLLFIFAPTILLGRPVGFFYMIAALAVSLWLVKKMFLSAMGS